MVCFQEVVETLGVYWFGRRLGRGWLEDLFSKAAKGRLKMGFRRPFGWVGKSCSLEDRVRAYRTHPTHKFQILCDSQVGVCPQAHTRFDAGYSLLVRATFGEILAGERLPEKFVRDFSGSLWYQGTTDVGTIRRHAVIVRTPIQPEHTSTFGKREFDGTKVV